MDKTQKARLRIMGWVALSGLLAWLGLILTFVAGYMIVADAEPVVGGSVMLVAVALFYGAGFVLWMIRIGEIH